MVHVLHLGLSYACNMRCAHCFVDRRRDALDPDTIKNTIQALFDRHGLFVVYYTHGEPLMSRHFEEITGFCKDLGLVQVLMTNGSLVNPQTVRQIKDSGISNVYVSVDSPDPGLHDANRNCPGAFDSALAGIRALQDGKIPVGISTTATRQNISQIPGVWKLACDLGVNSFSLLAHRIDGALFRAAEQKEYREFVTWYLRNAPSQRVNLFLHDPQLLPLIEEQYRSGCISAKTYEKYYEMNRCHYATTLSVTPDGAVSRCNLAPVPIGNICVDNIDTLLEKEVQKIEYPVCCSVLSGACQ